MFSEKSWEAYLELADERPGAFAQDPSLEIVFDRGIAEEFADREGITLGVVYRSKFNILVVDLVRSPDGRVFPYERLLPAATGPSVVIVPVLEGRFVLIEQYRHALRARQLAFPRGFGEDGLSAAENSRKELAEELGATAISASVIGKVASNSGISGDETDVVLCEIEDCELKQGYEGIENLVRLSADELEGWIAAGRITDSFTLSAWALFKARGGISFQVPCP